MKTIILITIAALSFITVGCEEGGQSNTDLSAQDSRPTAPVALQLPYCRPGEEPGDKEFPCQTKQ